MKDPNKLKKYEIFPTETWKFFVYFLFKGEKIVYIGITKNILKRITSHKSTFRGKFDSFSYIGCEKKDSLKIERKYLIKYNPKFNIQHKEYLSKLRNESRKLKRRKL